MTPIVAFALAASGCMPFVGDAAKEPRVGSADDEQKKAPPSPQALCAKVMELAEADMEGMKPEDRKLRAVAMKDFLDSCIEEASKESGDHPDAYARAAGCVMVAPTLDAAMQCDFGKVKPKQIKRSAVEKCTVHFILGGSGT